MPSTERNLKLLNRAKEKGYFIRCYYILTADRFGYLRNEKSECILMNVMIGILRILVL